MLWIFSPASLSVILQYAIHACTVVSCLSASHLTCFAQIRAILRLTKKTGDPRALYPPAETMRIMFVPTVPKVMQNLSKPNTPQTLKPKLQTPNPKPFNCFDKEPKS